MTGPNCPSSNASLKGSNQWVGIWWTEDYNFNDLQDFASGIGIQVAPPSGAAANTTVITPVGPNPGSQSQFETTQDIEAVLAMAPGLNGVYVFGGNTTAGRFQAMGTTTPLAYQISLSVADVGIDSNSLLALAVLATQGQSLVAASGDWGGTSPNGNDLRVVDFVTVVGGTVLQLRDPLVCFLQGNLRSAA